MTEMQGVINMLDWVVTQDEYTLKVLNLGRYLIENRSKGFYTIIDFRQNIKSLESITTFPVYKCDVGTEYYIHTIKLNSGDITLERYLDGDEINLFDKSSLPTLLNYAVEDIERHIQI